MRIGVVSDTHIHRHRSKSLPSRLLDGLAGVDLILHAGDWLTMDVLYELETIAPVEGVAGNNDGWDIIDRFGHSKVLTLAGYRIGLVHGHQGYKQTVLNAMDAFKGENVQAIVFGHSHVPFNQVLQGILMFNPGSPTDKRRQERYSYGILTLGDTVRGELFYF
jgi:hypothetical protein